MKRYLTTEEFIQRAKIIHGELYDYSKVDYINYTTKINIICSLHGNFYKTPSSHICLKQGCPKCVDKTLCGLKKLTTEEFIKKAKEIHGNKYNYSKVNYINA